jgi:hypothetical protein
MNKDVSRKKFLAILAGGIIGVPFIAKSVLGSIFFRDGDANSFKLLTEDDLTNYWKKDGTSSPATGNWDLGANNLTVDTNVLFVDATNDRVGVGKVPEYKLDVAGTLRIGTINPDPHLVFTRNGFNYIQAPATGTIAFLTNGATPLAVNSQLTLNTNGDSYFQGRNVGIGTTAPAYTLDVNGTIQAITSTGIRVFRDRDAIGSMGQLLLGGKRAGGAWRTYASLQSWATDVTAGATTADLIFNLERSGTLTEAMRITGAGNLLVTGNIQVGTTTVGTLSYNTNSSLSLGRLNTTTGNLGINIGTESVVGGVDNRDEGIAIGYKASCSAIRGIAIGANSKTGTSLQGGTIAIGSSAEAVSLNNIAIGFNAYAQGTFSQAFGRNAHATAGGSAIGESSTAISGIALGNNSRAVNQGIAIGIRADNDSYAFCAAIGSEVKNKADYEYRWGKEENHHVFPGPIYAEEGVLESKLSGGIASSTYGFPGEIISSTIIKGGNVSDTYAPYEHLEGGGASI